MIRLAIRTLIFLGSAAVGLLAASLILDGVTIRVTGFVAAVVVYAVIQSVISPFLTKLAATSATAFLGGTGLLASLIALIAASWIGDSLTITGGIGTWIAATVIVWVVTAVATLLLPLVLVKSGVEAARARRR